MDIKQLKILIAQDETRHFGQAAARCHITRPTLSMRRRSLEEELDEPFATTCRRLHRRRASVRRGASRSALAEACLALSQKSPGDS
jgi:DNA-binding transcriptional LysR family regulator